MNFKPSVLKNLIWAPSHTERQVPYSSPCIKYPLTPSSLCIKYIPLIPAATLRASVQGTEAEAGTDGCGWNKRIKKEENNPILYTTTYQ